MKIHKYLFVGICFHLSLGEAFSVYLLDADSGNPLKMCTVQIYPGQIEKISNEDGEIDIPLSPKDIPTEKLKIRIISGEYSGFEAEIDSFVVGQVVMVSRPEKKNTKSKETEKKIKSLKEFSVHKTNAFAGQLVSKDEIKSSFQVNFNDVVKALQTKAGVSFSGKESTSSLYVQGSPSYNTSFLYEKVEMSVSSSRLGETASMFNPLLMEQVQLHKAGYSTSLLGGTAGVVSLKSLHCDFRKWNLFLGVDNSIEFLANGPLYKDKVAGFFHFRRTLLEVYTALDTNKERKEQISTLPNILDINTKFSAKIGGNGLLNFVANFSTESVAIKDLKKSSKLFEDPHALENVEASFNHRALFGIFVVNYQHNITSNTSVLGVVGQTITMSTTSRTAVDKISKEKQKTDGTESFDSTANSYITQFVANVNHKISPTQDVDGGIRVHIAPRNFMFEGYFNHFGLLPTPNQGKYLTTPSQRSIKTTGFLVSPHISHSWSPFPNIHISEGLRLLWYASDKPWPIAASGHLHLEYKKVPFYKIYNHFGVYSQNIVSSHGKILNVTDTSNDPEKSVHAVFGIQAFLKYAIAHIEPFFKYNWDVLFSRNQEGLDNSGKSYNTGLSIGILQIPSPNDLIHLSLGYMYIFSKEKVTFRQNATTDNFYQYRTHWIAPKVDEWATPSHVRDHSLALSMKIVPFVRFANWEKGPSWTKKIAFTQQSFSLQFIFLSGSPYTPGESVIKRFDVDWPSKFTYQIIQGEYNSLKTPNIYKLDMKYSVPIAKKSEFFVSFLNLINLKNEYLVKNLVTKKIQDITTPPGTYGSEGLEHFGQSSIDSGFGKGYFSVRFGINIWLKIENRSVKLS